MLHARAAQQSGWCVVTSRPPSTAEIGPLGVVSIGFLSEIQRIIEAAADHDAEKLEVFVAALSKRLKENSYPRAAAVVERALNKSRRARLLPQSAMFASDVPFRIPLDPEAHVPLADLELLDSADVDYLPDNEVIGGVDRFIETITHRDQLVASGLSVPGNLLLLGPPGCGKTVTARHVAARLGLPLLTARMDAVVSSYLGNTAKNIRALFSAAATQNAVLFLDEVDAVGKSRDDEHELGELKRVVIGLLQNIDSVAGKIILIAATNHEQLLDPAIWRRFPSKVRFPTPSFQYRQALLEHFATTLFPSTHRTLTPNVLAALAHATEGHTAASIRGLLESEAVDAIIGNRGPSSLAMIAKALGVPSQESLVNLRQFKTTAKRRNKRYFTDQRIADILDLPKSRVAAVTRAR